MNKKRIGLNTFTGFLNIVGCLVSICLIFIAAAAVVNKTPIPSYIHISNYGILVVLLIFNVWAMMKSKANNISTFGHLLGIIGAILIPFYQFIALIFLIISAIMLFIQKSTK